MDSFLQFSLLVVLAGLGNCYTISKCSDKQLQNKIQGCFLQIFAIYGMGGSTEMQVLQISDNEQMDNLCSELGTATDCMQREMAACHVQEVTDMVIQTLSDTFGYVCGEGRQALLEEITCWQNPHLETSMAICEHQTKEAALRATSMSDVCGIMEGYKSCVQSVVTSLCNENAGNFVYNVFGHATAAVTSQMGCHVNLVHTRSIFGMLVRRGSQRK